MEKSLNKISGANENMKTKNFFMTPGISNDSRKMNTEDIFTQNKIKHDTVF